jgi:Rieske Fe-S protein
MSNDKTAGPIAEVVRDRRAVLRGAAVAGLAGVSAPLLAACGDDGTPGTAPGTTSAPTSAPSSAPSSAPGGGAVLGKASDVPVGGGVIYGDAKVVVTQPTAGQYKGFSAVCTHQSCIVGTVSAGTINCNCHGSMFNVADGSVAKGPAASPLPSVAVTVEGGNIIGPTS